MEGRDALARLDHLRRVVAGPNAHEQVEVVRLDRQRENLPPTLRTLALDQLPAACGYWPHQHRLAATRTPEEVVDDEMDAMLVAFVLMCLFHGLGIHSNRPVGKGQVL